MENRIKINKPSSNDWLVVCGGIAQKLHDLEEYESTRLTPQQIREMDRLYLEKCEEVNKLRSKQNPKKVLRPFECRIGGKTYYRANCPNCESVFPENQKIKFCPYCGQAIDW